MAHPLRIPYENAWYHVMNRGRQRQKVFRCDEDYRHFLDIVKETAGMFDLRVAAFCLMSNHYHLLLMTPQANLSRYMRHINGIRMRERFKKNRQLQKRFTNIETKLNIGQRQS